MLKSIIIYCSCSFLLPSFTSSPSTFFHHLLCMNKTNEQSNTELDNNPSAIPRVEFTATAVSVLESGKMVQLGLARSRNLKDKITIR